jgi:hypothetical protein
MEILTFTVSTLHSLVFGSNAGGAPGSLKALLTKITGINSKHGPFTCVICLGDMFPIDEEDKDEETGALLDGSLAVPCATYCMLGSRELPKRVAAKAQANNGELCENLFFLGESSLSIRNHPTGSPVTLTRP